MRPIKFRAWDVDEEEWYNNEKIPYQLIDNEGVFYWADDYEWNHYPGEVLITQYTGLKDVNGMEIYEGDVVEYTDLWSGQSYINEIYWKFGSLVFDVEFEEEKRYTVPIHSIHMDDDRGYEQTLKVLGNIYENPELLGDSQ